MSKQLMLGLGLLFLSIQIFAQCIQGNCQNGYGTFSYKSGAKYMGDFKNGKIQGQGILHFSNGDKYIGQWNNQYRDGQGKLIYKNGDVYQGTFVKNAFHNKGILAYANGDRYEGEFNNGSIEGEGTMAYANGSTYEGFWQGGLRHGQGTLVKDGQVIKEGTWEEDLCLTDEEPMTTEGLTVEKNLQNCNEEFCHSGRGIYRYPDGSRYIGDFRSGKPEGEGICYYANGDVYKGQWKNHAPNGEGIYTYTSGRVMAAIWQNGNPKRRLDAIYESAETNNVAVENSDEVKIWSVIVGVSTYEHMPALRFTDDDAYRFYAFLRSPEGGALPDNQIKILVDEDATKSNILGALKSTFLKADENDVIFFYYSGHGLAGSLIPVDYDGYNNQLMNEEITQVFNQSNAKHKVIFSDACYSGSLLAMKSPLNQMVRKYYQSFEETEGGLAFLTSSKSEEVSLEDSGLRQGIYTHYLIRGLEGEADKDRNKIVTISELFSFVERGVRQYTGNIQTPVITGNYDPNMPVGVVR